MLGLHKTKFDVCIRYLRRQLDTRAGYNNVREQTERGLTCIADIIDEGGAGERPLELRCGRCEPRAAQRRKLDGRGLAPARPLAPGACLQSEAGAADELPRGRWTAGGELGTRTAELPIDGGGDGRPSPARMRRSDE